jgi:hypothetical protein
MHAGILDLSSVDFSVAQNHTPAARWVSNRWSSPRIQTGEDRGVIVVHFKRPLFLRTTGSKNSCGMGSVGLLFGPSGLTNCLSTAATSREKIIALKKV